MCGIYGFIGSPTKKTRKILHSLGKLNELRGVDSSGVAIIYQKKHYVFKKAVNSNTFWNEKRPSRYIGIAGNSKKCIFLGHTRHATTGVVNDANSHPFEIGNYILTHNGVISNFQTLQGKYNTNYKVDSQIIPYLLNNLEYKEVFEKKLTGWFTAPYVDIKEPDVLNVATHNAPFAYAMTKHGIYYSSDVNHLKEALYSQRLQSNIVDNESSRYYTFVNKGNGVYIKKEKLSVESKIYSTYNWDAYPYWLY